MSILDSINEAEERAAKIRADAKAEAREIVRKAEAETRQAGERVLSASAKQAAVAVETARTEASAKMAEELEGDLAARKKEGDVARKRIPDAVTFILERVEMQC